MKRDFLTARVRLARFVACTTIAAIIVAAVWLGGAGDVITTLAPTPATPARHLGTDVAAATLASPVDARRLPALDSPSTSLDAHHALSTAIAYADCEALQTSGFQYEANGSLLDSDHPSPADKIRDVQAATSRCAQLGPYEFRQIDTLLETAARTGAVSAQVRLDQRRATRLLDRLATFREQGSQPLDADVQAAQTITESLEALASRGDRDAMSAIEQLRNSQVWPQADPIRGAAWRLASLQPSGLGTLTERDLQGTEFLVEDLNGDAYDAVIREALDIYSRCCAR